MTLVKSNFFPTIPQFFDDFLTRDLFDWGTHNSATANTTLPSVNILDTPENFTLEMAAPGMSKKDFHIELVDVTLTISADKNMQELQEGDRYVRREYSYNAFKRTFRLPKQLVDGNGVKATYKDGILRYSSRKKRKPKPCLHGRSPFPKSR